MVKEFVLPEFSLKHEKKKAMEKEYFGGYEDFLKEKSWEKRAKESIEEIERVIDEGLERKIEKREEKKEGEEIKKEIIYSSKRGYIVKVSYKEGGETKVSYYLVTKIEDIEEALDRISSYKPLIEEGEERKLFG
ncbi:MAG: hypothetical protein DRN29_08415 [Thermoplasmata archaeon]|nr:MAG: hypothetical protein DRN29_08415 [Thermoplasmata archaeon]